MKRIGLLAILVLGLFSSGAFAGVFAGPSRGDWLELIDTTKLPTLRVDQCLQASSYDRTGGNEDGFSGQFSALREENGAFVIFEDNGPGCVYRIWSANPGARRIEFYFDGETTPRLAFDKWEDMFLNKVPPFVEPFSRMALGGAISYVPLPYKKSLKIVTRERINFYQITYQKFAKGLGISSFSPKISKRTQAKMDRVAAAWNALGTHPWPVAQKTTFSPADATVKPGETAVLATQDGAGIVHSLEITTNTTDPKWSRNVRVRVTADGAAAPQIDCPFGDFFMQAFPGENVKSLLVGKRDDGTYYSFWPMPFASGIKVELVNEGTAPISVKMQWGGATMRSLPKNTGRFHATWQRLDPVPDGQPYPILNAKGRGHWCGVSIAMQGHTPGLGFLEGDEMLWIDDRDNTTYNGTGSEDYYNGGWYFGKTGSLPYSGCGYYGEQEGRCHAFRLHMTDPVPFQQQAKIVIEHGSNNTYAADYAGTTFWYGEPETIAETPAMPSAAQRLWRPGRIAGFTEAEDKAQSLEASAGIVDDSKREAFFSNGKAVFLPDGALASFDMNAVEEDVYELLVHFGASAGSGVAKASLDKGDSFGGQVEVKPDSPNGIDISLGKARVRKGMHRLTIRCEKGAVLVDAFLLKPSVKASGVQEAELATFKARGGAKVTVVDGRIPGASSDSFVAAAGKGPRGGVNFEFTTQKVSEYRVIARLLKGPDSRNVTVAVDGEKLGEPLACRGDKAEWTEALVVGVTNKLLPGKHSLTVLNSAKEDATLGIDYFVVHPATEFEGEALKIVESKGGQTGPQAMGDFGKEWSGGTQLFFRNEDERGILAVEIEIAKAGKQKIAGLFTFAPDFGIYQLSVDGTPVGQPFDAYAKKVKRADRVELGEIDLPQGKHLFRFECKGKNPASKGLLFGIDQLIVE